ncbi:SH3 domain-containing protein [Gracilinema caldarium]|uniref:Lipoprotein n=1 Tax=Gracilinema caldarium (strain ATCC 51460 / DSM 7334 / H1) TaxID=744872 RepID=F8EYV7_GRAC1|nr:SH3 domain-containing protein [Gracilinema caldarium]AEJ18903.1 putative lipoprotein [Gracilinema caldarium DSM 7334]
MQKQKGMSLIPLMMTLVITVLCSGYISSCSKRLGWGVVLWDVQNPAIPSGTLVPVYIKSKIDSVYVIGIPKEFQIKPEKKTDPVIDKKEVPLWQISFFSNRGKAQAFVKEFADYASLYAETLQDGLPIRAEPDNGARRVYRLRQGQVVKILSKAEGSPAMSGNKPLPGEWLQVLTDDGTIGYCFSYRLRIFETEAGKTLTSTQATISNPENDPTLESIFSKSWAPDWYQDMLDNQTIDLDTFTDQWGFFPSQDTGVLHLALPDFDKTYSYTAITKVDTNSWRFEGTPLVVTLRNTDLLGVQYEINGGIQRTALFVALPISVSDVITQEKERRLKLIEGMIAQGPVFQSETYGKITLSPDGSFQWEGFDLLVPRIIPQTAIGTGIISMRLFIRESIRTTYDGAFTMYFNALGGDGQPALAAPGTTIPVNFLYKVEPGSLRLEYLPSSSITGTSVLQRSSSPIILYFTTLEQ